MVGHHMADQVFHRHVFQLMDALGIQLADAVVGADPDGAVDGLHALHAGQGRGVDHLSGGQAVRRAAVDNAGAAGAGVLRGQVERAGLAEVRQQGQEAAAAAGLVAQPAGHPAVPHDEEVAAGREAVDQPVAAQAQVRDGDSVQALVLHHAQGQVPVHCGDASRRADVDKAVSVLRHGADADGHQLMGLVHAAEGGTALEKDAEVVGADPQPSLAVHIQAAGVRDAVGGFDALKAVSVVADQAGIAADPEKAVLGLGDGVGLRGWQAVAVVV